MPGMFIKGFLCAWLPLVTLIPIIPQHKLGQTKGHLLWAYITTSQKQQKSLKKSRYLNQTQEVQLFGKKQQI